jgi:uncharacterized protein YxeA
MNSYDIILIMLLIFSYIVILSIGVGLGYLIWGKNASPAYDKPSSFLKSQGKEQKNKEISIDDTKVVLGLNTDNYIKKFDNMAEEKKVKNNISSSVNKLKNMKGK